MTLYYRKIGITQRFNIEDTKQRSQYVGSKKTTYRETLRRQ